jgi:hypothetical protein
MIEMMVTIAPEGKAIFCRDEKDWQKMTIIRLREAYQQSTKQFV